MKYVLIKSKFKVRINKIWINLELSNMAKNRSSLNVILIDFPVLFEF